MGMTWKQIMKYESIINKISFKYSGDPELYKDVVQEVMLKLFEDKNLDIKNFNPATRDAAIRNTIRNKVIKVLSSKNTGRLPHDSLNHLEDLGYQVDLKGQVVAPLDNLDIDSDLTEEKMDTMDSINYIIDNTDLSGGK